MLGVSLPTKLPLQPTCEIFALVWVQSSEFPPGPLCCCYCCVIQDRFLCLLCLSFLTGGWGCLCSAGRARIPYKDQNGLGLPAYASQALELKACALHQTSLHFVSKRDCENMRSTGAKRPVLGFAIFHPGPGAPFLLHLLG